MYTQCPRNPLLWLLELMTQRLRGHSDSNPERRIAVLIRVEQPETLV
jgi:hypothetical protein